MRTLRAQVTALLIVAVFGIVAFANAASFFLVAPPGPPPPGESEVDELVLMAKLAATAPSLTSPGGFGIRAAPPTGRVREAATRTLQDALARRGVRAPVRVINVGPGDDGPSAAPGLAPATPMAPVQVALQLADGRWLVTRAGFGLMGPPPGRTLSLGTWLALVALGIIVVVMVAVRRLMKPLALVEEAAARIGPDGEPPVLAEDGPAEVKAAARAINRLSARLKGAMESRMRIVAGAAHDLRTPLTRMRLRAEFLPDEEERERWLADLAELDRIADSAIRLVREDAEGTPEEAIRLDRLTRDVVEEVALVGGAAVLARSRPVEVSGRPLSLKRAVRNLVMNAATHGRGARVSVAPEGNRAVLMIEDDGPGIPEALMGQVFEPFFRVDPARQTKIPGAGLGLAIASEIVTRHGGRLVLSNRPGGGLSQRVELPFAPDAPHKIADQIK